MNAGVGATPSPEQKRFKSNCRRLLGLLLFAALVRAQTFGDPFIGYDEQFYLLVGDRMWQHGALPFVDIFDRKPIGLFLIYAASRALGGAGFVQYQLVALLFVAATALGIARFARRIAGGMAPVVAACLYIVWLNFMECEGGQAPVFYNGVMVAAALLTGQAIVSAPRRLGLGAAAMLLVGAALQIKYTVVIEGAFFGLALLWAGYRDKWPLPRLMQAAALWTGCALLPTLAAFGYYHAIGHAHKFIFANFRSIFGRLPDPVPAQLRGLLLIAGILLPLAALAFASRPASRKPSGHPALARDPVSLDRHPNPSSLSLSKGCLPLLRQLKREAKDSASTSSARAEFGADSAQGALNPVYLDPEHQARRFVLLWLLAALAGLLLFGNYLNPQSAAPLIPPLVIAGAPCFVLPGRTRRSTAMFLSVFLVLSQIVLAIAIHAKGSRADARTLAMAARPRAGKCIYIYDGQPALYLLTHSCLPTRWAFPGHLDTQDEASVRAIGVDPAAEVQRVLATRPDAIVDNAPAYDLGNRVTHALVQRAMANHYHLVLKLPAGHGFRLVYRLNGA